MKHKNADHHLMKSLNFYPACGLNGYEGYGRVEIGLARGFAQAGMDYNLYPDPALPTLICGNPKWAASPLMEGQRVWLLTMLESTQASDFWVKTINGHCERVMVPVADMVALLQDSGVSVPIHVVSLGVDAFDIAYRERHTSDPFTFLSYSYGDIRKGAELAVMAFQMLYAGNANYRLIIKARDGEDVRWLEAVENDQIEVVRGKLSERQWHDLLYQAHCFVFPSRAEGFGLPPREAVLSGCPSIATRWLGMADVDCWGFGLGTHDMRPAQYEREVNNKRGALWAEPDFDDLLHWMQWIPAHYQQVMIAVRRQRGYLQSTCTWRRTAHTIQHLLEQHTYQRSEVGL